MVTISNYLNLKNCALAPQNTIEAPNLHLAGYCQNALTDFVKKWSAVSVMIVLDIPIENESRKLLEALENDTELCLSFDRHFLSLNQGFVLVSGLFLSWCTEFILETENRLRRETRLETENSSDMNPVKDEFPVLNLSVHFYS